MKTGVGSSTVEVVRIGKHVRECKDAQTPGRDHEILQHHGKDIFFGTSPLTMEMAVVHGVMLLWGLDPWFHVWQANGSHEHMEGLDLASNASELVVLEPTIWIRWRCWGHCVRWLCWLTHICET